MRWCLEADGPVCLKRWAARATPLPTGEAAVCQRLLSRVISKKVAEENTATFGLIQQLSGRPKKRREREREMTCSCAQRVFRRASQGPQGRVVPFGGARREARIVGYVLQSSSAGRAESLGL
jgi:alkylated DNA nucleotide flippase Atl1